MSPFFFKMKSLCYCRARISTVAETSSHVPSDTIIVFQSKVLYDEIPIQMVNSMHTDSLTTAQGLLQMVLHRKLFRNQTRRYCSPVLLPTSQHVSHMLAVGSATHKPYLFPRNVKSRRHFRLTQVLTTRSWRKVSSGTTTSIPFSISEHGS